MSAAKIRIGDVTVKTWAELMDALYDIPRTEHNRFRSDFVYRGLASHSWDLKTSLIRLGGEYEKVERPLLRNFSKYANPGAIPSDSLLVKLAVAQHYGLPTRVLDWTVSPKVALHFATAEEEHYDKDGVIWCIDVVKAIDLLPNSLKQILHEEYAFVFSVEMLEHVKTLEALDRLGQNHEFVLFFEPPSLDARIVNQGAILSVASRSTMILDSFLRSHPSLYHRVIIPKKLKWEVRDKLDQDNVTERMLFPGLGGLSTWLKRYYGPGPNRIAPPSISG
jgi:hypothetical protein